MMYALPMFRNWTKHSLERLLSYFKERNFTRGQVVYREGETPTHIYLVKEGEFRFFKKMVEQPEVDETQAKVFSNQLKRRK
jgi:CRP-like cAMP-binding protein